jgi:hypothetical protein
LVPIGRSGRGVGEIGDDSVAGARAPAGRSPGVRWLLEVAAEATPVLDLDDVKGVGLFRSDDGKTARLVGADEGANSTRDLIPPVVEPAMSAKSLVASSTQTQSPWPCYSAPPVSRTAASGPIRPG